MKTVKEEKMEFKDKVKKGIVYRADYVRYTVIKRIYGSETDCYIKTGIQVGAPAEREQKVSLHHEYFVDANDAILAVKTRAALALDCAEKKLAEVTKAAKTIDKMKEKDIEFAALPANYP